MPLQKYKVRDDIDVISPQSLVTVINTIIDHCNELERRLEVLEKPIIEKPFNELPRKAKCNCLTRNLDNYCPVHK